MLLLDSSFRASLAPFDVAALQGDASIICGLTGALRIAYVNPAWVQFGRENGAARDDARADLGSFVLEAIPPALRPFYAAMFERVLTTRVPEDCLYECSSPTTFRQFHMRVLPCETPALVVVHSLSQQAVHASTSAPVDGLYRGPHGILTQCCNCRRVRRNEGPRERWDWVPEYVEHVPPRTSHGICEVCDRYYYPQ